jgi:hypothetical protein
MAAYDDPFGKSSFESRDFKKKKGGKVQKNTPSFASVSNIEGLDGVDAPLYNNTDTVPKEIILTPDEHAYLCEHKPETPWDNYRPKILKMIESHSPGYLKTLPHTESPKILAPVVTRNKIISKLANANKNGTQYNWNDGQIKCDTFKIYLDTEKPRLFVSVCYGSKRNTRPVDEVQTANMPVA